MYDLDGVLYLGPEPVEHAAASVAGARARGMRACFVTNNAGRRPSVVAAHLRELGIDAVDEDVVTSAQAAARLLAERFPRGTAVLVLGSEGLAEEVAAAGLRPVRTADEQPQAVVQGLAPETGWRDLAEAAVALRAGAFWVAGNTDSTYPSPRGPLPGNGAFVAALEVATGLHPVVTGKPEPALHRESVERVGAQRPLVVGDRLDTDVLGAVRGGADSLLVLTGVVDRAALLAAPAGSRPTYVAPDLRALLLPQPEAVVRGTTARCAGATAQLRDGVVVQDDEGIDGLRAACALAWALADG
ncbi:MAG: family hydrolase [Frankiales bacterium]|nr:family hydrolase [Frankiales bacterium]